MSQKPEIPFRQNSPWKKVFSQRIEIFISTVSQQLAPTWQKVQERLGDSSIVVGKLDCTAHQELATRYAIRGFPTIKLFRSGRGIDYEGAREENAIVNWAKKATGPAVLSTKHKIEDMIAKHQVKPVFLFNGNTNSQGFEQFQAAAEKYVPNISFFKNKVRNIARQFWYINFIKSCPQILGLILSIPIPFT